MRGLATLVAGLGCAWVVGAVLTFTLHALNLGPVAAPTVAGLSSVNISTPFVAFAAGVAGMLALDTRSSSAVAVAISVTTIPAAAYLGVAAGVGATRVADALRLRLTELVRFLNPIAIF